MDRGVRKHAPKRLRPRRAAADLSKGSHQSWCVRVLFTRYLVRFGGPGVAGRRPQDSKNQMTTTDNTPDEPTAEDKIEATRDALESVADSDLSLSGPAAELLAIVDDAGSEE